MLADLHQQSAAILIPYAKFVAGPHTAEKIGADFFVKEVSRACYCLLLHTIAAIFGHLLAGSVLFARSTKTSLNTAINEVSASCCLYLFCKTADASTFRGVIAAAGQFLTWNRRQVRRNHCLAG